MKKATSAEPVTEPSSGTSAESSPEASVDPVCGMDVDVQGAKYTSDYGGKTYYFCNPTCKERFDKDPSKYIGK